MHHCLTERIFKNSCNHNEKAPYRNVIKLRNCNPAPVILEQAFGARFFAALENDSPKRAAKDLGGGGASCFLNLMTLGISLLFSFEPPAGLQPQVAEIKPMTYCARGRDVI